MRFLLDTHIWLWTLGKTGRFHNNVREILENPENILFLSAVSSWEITIKYQLGKLPLPEPPRVFIPARLIRDGTASLPIRHHHTLAVADLPRHHRDPFDRLLIAQAQTERMTLITADHQIKAYDVDAVFT